MENTELFSEEFISQEIKNIFERNLQSTYEKIFNKIIEDLNKIDSKNIIDNVLENFDIKKIKHEELKKKFKNQVQDKFYDVVFETTSQLLKRKCIQENQDEHPINKKRKISKNEISKETNTKCDVLRLFWKSETFYDRCISQDQFNTLTHLIFDYLFEVIKDYKKIHPYFKYIKLDKTNESYNLSIVSSRCLFELQIIFTETGLPYIKPENFNLRIDDHILEKLGQYIDIEYLDFAYKNLIVILTVISNHIIRGGSMKFDKNFHIIEKYPFIRSLFLLD